MSKISFPKLIVILGPTGSGKSDLAIKLAKKFNGEIVSADSRQIYKEMDIGTAKASFPQHMINLVKPNQEFTLAQYKKQAIKIIKDIQKRGKLPFLVGGTGLYIQAVVDNLQIPKVKPNKKIRNQLAKLTNQQLFQKLKKIDPKALELINMNNKRRLIRALEVCLITKKPFSKQRKKGPMLFAILQIGLKLDKQTLEKRISQRVEKMFKAGLVAEVKKLAKKYSPDLPSMSSIGYQEIITSDQAKELIILHTQQYARRQMSWFRQDKRIKWIEEDYLLKAEQLLRDWLYLH